MDKILSQAAVQTEEGDPDGNPQKQGDQRGVDTPQQRAPTATQGQPMFCFGEHDFLATVATYLRTTLAAGHGDFQTFPSSSTSYTQCTPKARGSGLVSNTFTLVCQKLSSARFSNERDNKCTR